MVRTRLLAASVVLAAAGAPLLPALADTTSDALAFPPGTHLTADFPYGLTQA